MGAHRWGRTHIDDNVKDSLTILKDRVILGGPRRVLAATGRVFHLYTDACFEQGEGGLGGVLYDGCGKLLSFFSSKVGSGQVAVLNPEGKKTIIFEFEALCQQKGFSRMIGLWCSLTTKQF